MPSLSGIEAYEALIQPRINEIVKATIKTGKLSRIGKRAQQMQLPALRKDLLILALSLTSWPLWNTNGYPYEFKPS